MILETKSSFRVAKLFYENNGRVFMLVIFLKEVVFFSITLIVIFWRLRGYSLKKQLNIKTPVLQTSKQHN